MTNNDYNPYQQAAEEGMKWGKKKDKKKAK